ncbi:hypothetical protein [Chitinimonas koreensis]|uniref:hypothetical protein n=1 Tax=Chitinimonas koreensis TaxID=356302 RepID=UPI001654BF9B|nr:hypothetical protein [Chitinimonas koreensis]QNM96795.1 hypothetical protein H9L41_00055 [Chitinimonas koreensis]
MPGLQALLQLQPQAISTSMLLGACLALLPLAVILGLAKLFDSPLASSLTVPPAPIRLPGLLVIALLWLGSIAGLSLAVAAVDDFKAEVAERARQRDFEREYLAGQTGNSFVVAFCHGRLGEARSLLMQRPQWGDAAALTHLGRHCLAPADGRSGFDPARLDLLVEALAAEERRAGSMDSADCPALRTALVRRLGSWDPMGTFRRFHRYDLSLRCRDRQEDPPAPLWWVPFSSNVAYSGAPLMPSAADFAEFETLGIDLRETDALGHTFLTAGLAHQLDGQALRDLLDRGLPSALRQGPPVSPAVPDLAVELMYRRFGWQQAKTTPADLAVMLERVGEPTAAQLAQARLDVSGLRNLGLDRERATALADYLAEHGIHLAER